jgi:hypothetical protein
VILRLRVHSHHAFHTGPSGSRDLYYTANITLSESLLGFQRILFYHLDGRGIKVDCPAGERIIKHGDTFFLKGEGMPKNASTHSRAGDLYVKFNVEMPDLQWVRKQQSQLGGSEVSFWKSTSFSIYMLTACTPLPDNQCYASTQEGRSGNTRGQNYSGQVERVPYRQGKIFLFHNSFASTCAYAPYSPLRLSMTRKRLAHAQVKVEEPTTIQMTSTAIVKGRQRNALSNRV